MNLKKPPKRDHYFIFIAALALAAALLIPGIGGFGMWEPHETGLADIADSLLEQGRTTGSHSTVGHLEQRVVATSWSIFGKSELTARLPLAIVAIMTVAALFLLVNAFAGTRLATFATMALVFSPVFLFHGRQITSGLFVLLGEILAVGGLLLFARASKTITIAAGAVCALVGLVFGLLESGALIGIAAPTATVSIALLISGNQKDADGSLWNMPVRQSVVLFGGALLALLSTTAFMAVAFLAKSNIPLITGADIGASHPIKTFDFIIEQLLYGWFPWSGIAVIALLNFFRPQTERTNQAGGLLSTSLVISGLAVGYLTHTFYVSVGGGAPIFLALPMSLAVALAIDDLENRSKPAMLSTLVVLLLFVITVRDFTQKPLKILSGYSFEKIPIPKSFGFDIGDAVFIAPTFLFIVFIGLVISSRPAFLKWRKRISLPLMILAGALFAGYLSFSMVPGLSTHLSSKYAVESYEKFKKGSEPLGVFGPAKFVTEGKHLRTQEELATWLDTETRVFALFPPRDLAKLNSKMRERTGEHLFVLDAESDRFLLATSKPEKGEKNTNKIAKHVRSTPFDPPPEHPLEINFNNKITLLGWDIKGPNNTKDLVAGKKGKFITYWRCDANVGKDYKIFMHIDGPGGRMNGDHEPVGAVFTTANWAPGDYVRDVYTHKVPVYQKKGKHTVRLGMFSGSKRLKIKNYPSARENAIVLTKLEVK